MNSAAFQVGPQPRSLVGLLGPLFRALGLGLKLQGATRELRMGAPDRLAIDVITGGSYLREWVDDPQAACGDFEERLARDETSWLEERRDLQS